MLIRTVLAHLRVCVLFFWGPSLDVLFSLKCVSLIRSHSLPPFDTEKAISRLEFFAHLIFLFFSRLFVFSFADENVRNFIQSHRFVHIFSQSSSNLLKRNDMKNTHIILAPLELNTQETLNDDDFDSTGNRKN